MARSPPKANAYPKTEKQQQQQRQTRNKTQNERETETSLASESKEVVTSRERTRRSDSKGAKIRFDPKQTKNERTNERSRGRIDDGWFFVPSIQLVPCTQNKRNESSTHPSKRPRIHPPFRFFSSIAFFLFPLLRLASFLSTTPKPKPNPNHSRSQKFKTHRPDKRPGRHRRHPEGF